MKVAGAAAAGRSASPWDAARQQARDTRGRIPEGDQGGGQAEAFSRPADTDAALAAALGAASLDARPRRPDDALLAGAHAVLDSEAETVWYREDVPAPERRLLLAHELGHYHLHHGGAAAGVSCACDESDLADDPSLAAVGYGPRQRRETEANVWAREFLLPAPVARRLFFDEGLTAGQIAERAGVPMGVVYGQLGHALTPQPPLQTLTLPPPLSQAREGVPRASPLGGSESLEAPGAESLDPSQARAARAEAGPLLVGAGPGTGKTRTLTERVLFLVRERGIPPGAILALTFSRKAADEMRERIAARDPEIGRRASIGTFHAYGLDLLRRRWQEAGLPPRPLLLDSVDALALLERRLAAIALGPLRYLHDPAYPLPDALRAIARAKEEMVGPEDFAARADALGDPKLQDVARLYAVYEELLREKGAFDFSDLVCRALRLLEENDAVRAAEQARWRAVLVDEYQDVNRAGARLARVLTAAADGATLWAVGDLRQAIYAFRGASPANVARFAEDFPTGRRTDLAVNYRSAPDLVALFGHACAEPGAWQAARSGSGGALLAVAPDDVAQSDGIAAQIRAFAAAGHPYGDQVVLCRTRGQARQMRAALGERGIPVAADPAENDLLSHRDVRDLLALLSRAAEPSGPARRRFPELPDDLARLPPTADAATFFQAALWGDFGLARRLADPAAVLPLLTLAVGFRERAAVLLDPAEDPRRAFLAHVRRMARLGVGLGGGSGAPDAAEAGPADAVRVLTVHASKGLEFPVVFVPNLSAGKFPSRPGPSLVPPAPLPDAEPEDDEEARLFFVALTRARDRLVLSRAEKYNGRAAQPSPLLACLREAQAAGLVRAVEWPASAPQPLPPLQTLTPPPLASALDPPLSQAREGEPEGSHGSLSAPGAATAADLALYLRCPRRYCYERVLDVPTGERDAYSRFRRAVRAALDDPAPPVALDAAWAEHGPDPAHPHAPLYRAAADAIVAQAAPVPPRAAGEAEPPVLSLALENGVVTVQPDAAAAGADGDVLECRTFRKPPADGGDAPPEPRLSLLQEAAAAAGRPTVVRMRYLQTGDVRPVADKPKQRQKHLAAFDDALRGIRLQVWNPEPADPADCPACPYFFVCPD